MAAQVGLQRIGQSAVYLRKATGAAQASGSAPKTVLMLSWMGGKLPHIQKYSAYDARDQDLTPTVDGYASIYPSADLMYGRLSQRIDVDRLIRCEPSMFYTSMKSQEALVQPAIKLIRDLGPSPSLLVHVASNGGSIMIVTVAKMLARQNASIKPALPAKAIIYDSTPGVGDLTTMLRAFSVPVAKSFFLIRWSAYAVISLAYVVGRLFRLVTGRRDRIERMRDEVLDERLLPQSKTSVGFIYSKTDELIQHEQVEAQIARYRAKDIEVQTLCLDKSSHVAHLRTAGPERYFGLIKSVWDTVRP